MGPTRDKLTPDDQAAFDLCVAIGVEPWACVEKYERRFIGYDGDYYMNWARDRVEEFNALRAACGGNRPGD